jgi:hypothetical protein
MLPEVGSRRPAVRTLFNSYHSVRIHAFDSHSYSYDAAAIILITHKAWPFFSPFHSTYFGSSWLIHDSIQWIWLTLTRSLQKHVFPVRRKCFNVRVLCHLLAKSLPPVEAKAAERTRDLCLPESREQWTKIHDKHDNIPATESPHYPASGRPFFRCDVFIEPSWIEV